MTDLAHVLRAIPHHDDPRLLAGDNPADDAAVYRLRDDLALVQTVDFFTPIVDDPYTFGQIAAANSLSDVYAVGGTPITALNIVAFPVKTLDIDILAAILRGGADKAREAGVTIVGGHTVDDEEPKYGLSVTGTVDPAEMVTTRGARPGDLLVLTKPLGTGLIATALKAEGARPEHVSQSVRWMTTLNRGAASAMMAAGAHAATDITGFGLLGHLLDLCRASGVHARLVAGETPLLPGALEYASRGYVSGGLLSNREHVTRDVDTAPELDNPLLDVLLDPQTSGGLLVCLAPETLHTFAGAVGHDALAAVVGTIVEAGEGPIVQISV